MSLELNGSYDATGKPTKPTAYDFTKNNKVKNKSFKRGSSIFMSIRDKVYSIAKNENEQIKNQKKFEHEFRYSMIGIAILIIGFIISIVTIVFTRQTNILNHDLMDKSGNLVNVGIKQTHSNLTDLHIVPMKYLKDIQSIGPIIVYDEGKLKLYFT